jgi:hypothetical protein
MTAHERLNAHPVALQPSRNRAQARNAEVRSERVHDAHEVRSRITIRPTLQQEPASALTDSSLSVDTKPTQAICRPLKSHS